MTLTWLVWLGALLFLAGIAYMVMQPLMGRLSRLRRVRPAPSGKTLEPENPGRGLDLRTHLPGLIMAGAGALILLLVAAF